MPNDAQDVAPPPAWPRSQADADLKERGDRALISTSIILSRLRRAIAECRCLQDLCRQERQQC
jgi:hypothetical protein